MKKPLKTVWGSDFPPENAAEKPAPSGQATEVPKTQSSAAPVLKFQEGERQKPPRVSDTPPAPSPPPKLSDYQPIIGEAALDELRFLATSLRGKTAKMVNSTAVGGGVAEMLNRLIPLLGEVEVPTRWDVITGGNDFFELTKAFHNALHGGEYTLTKAGR